MCITGVGQKTGSVILYVPELKILNVTTFHRREIILNFRLKAEYEKTGVTVMNGLTLNLIRVIVCESDSSWKNQNPSLLLKHKISTVWNQISSIRSTT
jgi:hypothetical protein